MADKATRVDFDHDRVEARSVPFTDVDTSKDGKTFTGYAAVFDGEADLGDFTESITRGAFRRAIKSSGNIPMLLDHNRNMPPLATTQGGTLRLREDGKGLRVEADIANHYVGDALREMISRGDIRGMSFGFIAGRGNSVLENRGGKPHRNLIGFRKLTDVSPTWDPAYANTEASFRSAWFLQSSDSMAHKVASARLLSSLTGERAESEFRAVTTGELENTLEGLQSIAEALEAALNQVGFGETEPDEQADTEDVSSGPFSDQQYADALETIQSLIEAAEGLLEGVGRPDPDEGDTEARSTDAAPGVDEESAATEGEEERRAGADQADVELEAAARRRRLHVMGLSLSKSEFNWPDDTSVRPGPLELPAREVEEVLRYPRETWSPEEQRRVTERRREVQQELSTLAAEAERVGRNLSAEEAENFDRLQDEYLRLKQ